MDCEEEPGGRVGSVRTPGQALGWQSRWPQGTGVGAAALVRFSSHSPPVSKAPLIVVIVVVIINLLSVMSLSQRERQK